MPHFGLHYLWLPDESLGGWSRVRSGLVGDLMTFDAAIADRPLSRRRKGRLETVTIALAAVALSLGAAAWITDSDLSTLASAALPPGTDRISSFEDRFIPASSMPTRPALQALDLSLIHI